MKRKPSSLAAAVVSYGDTGWKVLFHWLQAFPYPYQLQYFIQSGSFEKFATYNLLAYPICNFVKVEKLVNIKKAMHINFVQLANRH